MATGSVQLAVGRSHAPLPHCDSRGRNRFWIWLARRGTRAPWADWAWAISTIPVLLALLVEIGRSLRRGDFGLDIVAALSMSAELIFGEELAAAIVALMYAGGQYLETYAEGRAQRDMTALLARAPRTTMRLRDGKLEEIGIDLVAVGDRLLVCATWSRSTGRLPTVSRARPIGRRSSSSRLRRAYFAAELIHPSGTT